MSGPSTEEAPARAVLDACVLYPATLRGVLLWTAEQEAFAPVWSERILAETRGALTRTGAMERGPAERLTETLQRIYPDASVPSGSIRAIESQMPNDPKDRHVLAAAVASGTPVVVTQNLRDFRAEDLARVGVRAVHPDAFLVGLLDRAPEVVRESLALQSESMRSSSRWSPGQILGHLKGEGRGRGMAPRFAAAAEAKLDIRAVPPPPRANARGRPGLDRTRGRDPRSR